jgi:hypothetical protein
MTTKAPAAEEERSQSQCATIMLRRPEGAPLAFRESITWQVKLHKRTHQVFENKGFSFWLRDEPTAARPRSPI